MNQSDSDIDDIRWQQRLQNYLRALDRLKNAVELSQARPLTDLEQQGLIQAFEFTHELAWNVMKDYLQSLGHAPLMASRDATRAAFKAGLIHEGETWMDMILSRNLSSHTYNQDTANLISSRASERYLPLLLAFGQKMRDIQHASGD
ncbi:MAG: nucleotidyltransferase [Comamonadaceae bacterium CG1_02_60_18]|nr:MAG: nucleotidyltransferase [Comamonadaceae bacterium CG1_02_60_18]PIQ53033.1 MAG: nucleotidyltransferase [Comamonadaceae bacterium CG12_big_fil_rev_8_21_14_0_65_59_15]